MPGEALLGTLDDLAGRVVKSVQTWTDEENAETTKGVGREISQTREVASCTSHAYITEQVMDVIDDTDPTCGTSDGDLVKKTDAAGDTICFAYALHRMTGTTYSGNYASVTPSRYFVYDSATVDGNAMANAKARLAEAYTCFSPCTTKLTDIGFSYTARGEARVIYESTPHSAGYNWVGEPYWANGAPSQLTNNLGNLPNVTYGIDGEGRLYSASDSFGETTVSSTTYNAASLPLQVSLGSSDSDSFAYDMNTYRMKTYTFNVNGKSVVGNLNWNPLGTLGSLAITDPFNSADAQTCTYSHDDFARIASANCGSAASQTFSYDAFGNIDKSGSPYSFMPNYSTSPSTNQMTKIGNCYPTYDADGNATNDCLNTYQWDANGRPVNVDGVNVTYDALGRMVEQNRSGTYTEIVYAPDGGKIALMNGSSLQKGFIPLTGGAMAVYNSSGLAYYRHSDWLGSSRFASTPTPPTSMHSDVAYAPFGDPYAQAGTTDLSFTGMNQDTASGIYDFPAREYSGVQGRWPSPDPAGMASANPADPQSWDRYAYVRNSPLMMTDPSGLEGEPGCNPNDPSCPGTLPCTDIYCGPGILPNPAGPDVTSVVTVSPTPTTGLPNNGIFATGPGVDYSWFGLLNWAFGFSPVGALNWTGSGCDPSVPDCGATLYCPDEGGPCVLQVGSNTGGAGGSWDTASTGSSWWNGIGIAGISRWSGGPAAKFATRQIPGAGNPYRVTPNPELTPGPTETPTLEELWGERAVWWYKLIHNYGSWLGGIGGKGWRMGLPNIIIVNPCSMRVAQLALICQQGESANNLVDPLAHWRLNAHSFLSNISGPAGRRKVSSRNTAMSSGILGCDQCLTPAVFTPLSN